MKRKLVLLVVLCMCILVGCGGNDDSGGGLGPSSSIDKENEEDNTLVDQMEIKECYYENGYGDTIYFLVLTNNSEKTVKVCVNSIAKDANGNTIGATDSEGNGIGSGEQICLENYFETVEGAAGFEYIITVKEDTDCKSALNDLEIKESRTSEKVILTCTNNGNEAPFVEASALFYKDGQLIGYNYTYIVDDESELKPGATLSEELTYDKEFDDIQVFVRAKY